jgi:general L-amino acid transport system permease protein
LRPAFWRSEALRGLFWQCLLVAVLAAGAWYLAGNAVRNLAARHIASGFGFLWQSAPIPIAETPISYQPSVDDYARALLIGLLNTLKVAVCGIVLATIIGTVVGVARLSANALARGLATAWVEALRNTPPLLQLLMWYSALRALPPPRQAWHWPLGIVLSNRGLIVPTLHWQAAHGLAALAFLAGLVVVLVLRRGGRRPAWPVVLTALVVPPLVVWAALGAPFGVSVPVLHGFNFQGGLTLTPEFAALLTGLTVYTSAYIAEIVRAGILAVPRGQWEAASALGLQRGQTLRLVIVPQALRVIIPPLTSEYLNLTKNSTLAVAIGFQDLMSISETTLNQTGQSIEVIAILMAVFLVISVSISAAMNRYGTVLARRYR